MDIARCYHRLVIIGIRRTAFILWRMPSTRLCIPSSMWGVADIFNVDDYDGDSDAPPP